MEKTDTSVVKYISIGETFKGKEFRSFNHLRKMANETVRPHRHRWLMAVLIKNSVFVNLDEMTKREIHEIFTKKMVSITDSKETYSVYIKNELVGEWSNLRKIIIDHDGILQIKIQYIIY